MPPSALRASAPSGNRRRDAVACRLDLQFRRTDVGRRLVRRFGTLLIVSRQVTMDETSRPPTHRPPSSWAYRISRLFLADLILLPVLLVLAAIALLVSSC